MEGSDIRSGSGQMFGLRALPLPFLLLRIGVYQRTDHALIGYPPLPRSALEKGDRALGQAQRHLHVVLAQHQSVRRRQEILDHPDVADLAFAVSNDWLFHRSPFLSASSRLQKS